MAKEMNNKVKKLPIEWKKCNRQGLIYKELQKQQQENEQPSEEMGKRKEETIFKELIQMSNRPMKKCSGSLAVRELQIKNCTEVPSNSSDMDQYQEIY